jgi:hypothetical protein
MAITYTRTFAHVDWIDNVDRVQAGGDGGFNGRFHSVEAEFDTISGVVTQVDGQLTTHTGQISALAQQVSALGGIVQAPITIRLVPQMFPFNPDNPSFSWSQIYWSATLLGQPAGTYVKVPVTNQNMTADGVLPLALPEGVKLLNLTAIGQAATPANMTTVLVKESRSTPFNRVELAKFTGFPTPQQIQGTPVFTSSTDLFYIRATIANAAADDKLRGFAITYQPV